MTLNKSAPPAEATELAECAGQVQYTAERIAHQAMRYKTYVTAPKYCKRTTYADHLMALKATHRALLNTMLKLNRLTRQFMTAAENAK